MSSPQEAEALTNPIPDSEAGKDDRATPDDQEDEDALQVEHGQVGEQVQEDVKGLAPDEKAVDDVQEPADTCSDAEKLPVDQDPNVRRWPHAKNNDLVDGPPKKEHRECTDIICLVWMFVMLITLLVLGIKGFATGHSGIFVHGRDHDGLTCGISEGVKDYPFVYWPTISAPLKSKPSNLIIADALEEKSYKDEHSKLGVCVKRCPEEYTGRPMKDMCPQKDEKHCTWYGRQSQQVLGNYCFYQADQLQVSTKGVVCETKNEAGMVLSTLGSLIQDELGSLKKNLKGASKKERMLLANTEQQVQADVSATTKQLSKSVAERTRRGSCTDGSTDVEGNWIQTVGDIMKGRFLIIFWTPFCAIMLGIIYLAVLKSCSRCMLLFCWCLLLKLGTGAVWLYGHSTTNYLEGYTRHAAAFLFGSFVSGLTGLLLVCFMVGYNEQFSIAARVVKPAMDCLLQCKSMLLVPIAGCIASFFWTIWIVMAFIHVFAQGIEVKPAPTQADEVGRYTFSALQVVNMLFHFFAFLYGNAFITGICTTANAANAAIWYFSPMREGTEERDAPESLGLVGLKLTLLKHSGSIALGSFFVILVNIIQLPRACFQRILTSYEMPASLKGCGQACLGCSNYLSRFKSHNAYIMMGIISDTFATSAESAHDLGLRNEARFMMVDGLGWVLSWIGGVFVTYCTVLCTGCIIDHTEWYQDNLQSSFGPIAVCGGLAFYLGTVLTGLVGTTADTLFFCFNIDAEMKSESAREQGPQMGPSEFEDFSHDDDLLAYVQLLRKKQPKDRLCCGS